MKAWHSLRNPKPTKCDSRPSKRLHRKSETIIRRLHPKSAYSSRWVSGAGTSHGHTTRRTSRGIATREMENQAVTASASSPARSPAGVDPLSLSPSAQPGPRRNHGNNLLQTRLAGCLGSSYCILAYSALACLRTGMSGSASFQRVKKS